MKNIFIILFLIFPHLLSAKYPLVRNFSRNMYQGGKQNWSIAQNKDYKMYFANNNGLLEYDSNIWKMYPIANYTNIRSIMYDSTDGKLYAGAFNEFGYYLHDDTTSQLKYYSLSDSLPDKEHNFNEVWNISKDEKNIYFQCDKNIIKYSAEGKMTTFSFDYKLNKTAVIYNTLIITSIEAGVQLLNGDMVFKFPNSEILTGKQICAILPYTNKQILFVTAFNGVYIYNGEEILPFSLDITDFLRENQVFCATIQNDKLAFGTVMKGLVIKDLKNNTNSYINTYSGLQNNTILSIKFDKDDNLWLGLDKGIDYICINTPINNLFSSNILYGSGYTSLIKDNMLYLGTNQGLYMTPYPIENTPEPTQIKLIEQMQGQAWDLIEIDNTIFCGNDQGAYIIKDDKAQKIEGVNGTWKFRELKKNPGNIIASSYQGFYILRKQYGEWKFSHYIKGFNESGGMFDEDENGNIWFSHWMKGLYKLNLNASLDSFTNISLYDYEKGLPTIYNNSINRVDNEMIFSSDGGFYKYSEETDRIIHDEKANKQFGVSPTSVKLHESPYKDVWAISPLAINRITNHGNNIYSVDSISYKSVLSKLIIGFQHLNFIDKNTVLISTEDGFSYLNTNISKSQGDNPHIFIRSVYATNYNDSLIYSKNERAKDTDKNYKFPYIQNSLRFEYVLPEYQYQSVIEYSYFLQGYDQKWSNYSSENTKEYTRLDQGDYIFKVKGYNKISGETSETSFKFTILPPWYRSPFAFVAYFCLILATLYLIGYFFNKRSQHAVRKVKIEKDKQLIAQKRQFLADAEIKEREIIELKNQQLEFDLKHKSHELASSTMNLIRKNEILFDISVDIEKLSQDMRKKEETLDYYRKLQVINDNIKQNIEHDNDWEKFSENFDMVYENYLERLGQEFPQLNPNDKRLCAYLKMNLSSKDIAPLLNISVRSVETTRYRLRKKMGLNRDINLGEFLQKF